MQARGTSRICKERDIAEKGVLMTFILNELNNTKYLLTLPGYIIQLRCLWYVCELEKKNPIKMK